MLTLLPSLTPCILSGQPVTPGKGIFWQHPVSLYFSSPKPLLAWKGQPIQCLPMAFQPSFPCQHFPSPVSSPPPPFAHFGQQKARFVERGGHPAFRATSNK